MWPFNKKESPKYKSFRFNLESSDLDKKVTYRNLITLLVFIFGYNRIDSAIVTKSGNTEIHESI